MEKYIAQLEQVNAALALNPENKQLTELKNKLEAFLFLKSSENDSKAVQTRQIKEHTSDFQLQVGEACEIFDETVKYWRPGHIVSMTLERDFYIVTFDKDKSAKRIAAIHIRRPLLKEKKPPTKPLNKMVRKSTFKPKSDQPETELSNAWKKFSNKNIKK